LAGGCFWGVQKYLSLIPGVMETQAGYANGHTENPLYEDVCRRQTGHAETVHVAYDETQLSLDHLLSLFFEVIDPVSLNRQGEDTGDQYRTGIYYRDESDFPVIRAALDALSVRICGQVVVECRPLRCFYPAEEDHQDYLVKNPGGYCHIHPRHFERAADFRREGH
jgi:peptide methionine sulfoxide reductase msrA/msrB